MLPSLTLKCLSKVLPNAAHATQALTPLPQALQRIGILTFLVISVSMRQSHGSILATLPSFHLVRQTNNPLAQSPISTTTAPVLLMEDVLAYVLEVQMLRLEVVWTPLNRVELLFQGYPYHPSVTLDRPIVLQHLRVLAFSTSPLLTLLSL